MTLVSWATNRIEHLSDIRVGIGGDTLTLNERGENPQPGSNWRHYVEAMRIYSEYITTHFADALRRHEENNPGLYIPIGNIGVAPENELVPIEGYLSFYCDLLGFSAEITGSGTDSLPDYYGAAFVYAIDHPHVKVYLLSDSCSAFAPAHEAIEFIDFVSAVYSEWLADGMLPQCFIGYGSFVERKPDLGPPPANFFGTQITGTALVDAVSVQKQNKSFGARILLSQSAREHLPQSLRIVVDGSGNLEFLPKRALQFDLLDCVYYLLCLREHESDASPFQHYTHSFASRVVRSGDWIIDVAANLVAPYFADASIEDAITEIRSIVQAYESTSGAGEWIPDQRQE